MPRVLCLTTLALAAGLGLITGCAASLRHPTPGDAALVAPRWPGTTLADLERGRSLYVRRCSGCHTLILPDVYPAEEWPQRVDEMAEQGRLAAAERDDVVRFLMAVASDGARDPVR